MPGSEYYLELQINLTLMPVSGMHLSELWKCPSFKCILRDTALLMH